jgi:hypothetical protein
MLKTQLVKIFPNFQNILTFFIFCGSLTQFLNDNIDVYEGIK